MRPLKQRVADGNALSLPLVSPATPREAHLAGQYCDFVATHA